MKSYTGHWYSCDVRGGYTEIHIFSDSSVSYIGTPVYELPNSYHITNDTLIFIDTLHMWHDDQGKPGIIINKCILENENSLKHLIINRDTIQQYFTRFPQQLDLSRVDSSRVHYQLHLDFESREKIIACPDKRTEEQIRLDSISELELRKLIDDIQ